MCARRSKGDSVTDRKLTPAVLDIDPQAETDRICRRLVEIVGQDLRRRGVVVALSGGVDSSVCAALAVRAFGPNRVFGLLLPEKDSSRASEDLGRRVAEHLGIAYLKQDIAPALEAIGCYRWRDEAIATVFPDYRSDWKSKLVIAGGVDGRFNYFKLVVQAPDGTRQEKRLDHKQYLQIVAATNYKQRIRKTIEYFHADRLHYAVIGTPNRLEYDQGFFVKNGDGSADVKPIAHLYKTQVYTLARYLGLPEAVCSAKPTTDTYSLPQGQDEFYFALPHQQMDLALWAHNHAVPVEQLGACLGISREQAAFIYRDLETTRRTTAYLHARPLLVEDVPELRG
jgi:NAD+ synthase